MSRGGMFIRLIDVVLILLFGFISISELSEKSPIQLPVSSQTPPSPPDPEKVLFVAITADGRYVLEQQENRSILASQLRGYLQAAKRTADDEGLELRVRVRSNWNTPIKYTMYVADLCDELDIAKGIEVQRMRR
jgi:biopolymer transport protein ExbD